MFVAQNIGNEDLGHCHQPLLLYRRAAATNSRALRKTFCEHVTPIEECQYQNLTELHKSPGDLGRQQGPSHWRAVFRGQDAFEMWSSLPQKKVFGEASMKTRKGSHGLGDIISMGSPKTAFSIIATARPRHTWPQY
jgi:hypothetical protein